MNQYYTRTGDDGYTGILGESRLPKNHPRMETLGAIDEASAAIGMARAMCGFPQTNELLLAIQRDLYGMMAEVAARPEHAKRFRVINSDRVTWIEQHIDLLSKTVDLPRGFTVSGNSIAGAALNMARTIVRRAERRIVDIFNQDEIENINIVRYMNRLSSLLFILEATENVVAGKDQFTLSKKD